MEDLAVTDLAKAIPTPFYCYSYASIQNKYREFSSNFTKTKPLICFAVKANSNIAVLKTLGQLGAGADCVSQGEIIRALKSGIPAKKIVFSGVGKTAEEIEFALKSNILQFNVESESELKTINLVAQALGKKASLAIRVNPDVDCGSHYKISTGKKDNKFGINIDQTADIFKYSSKLKFIEVIGISTHIGSQILELKPYKETFRQIRDLVMRLRQSGFNIKRIDLGGGMGISYQAKEKPFMMQAFADLVAQYFKPLNCELILEPGRVLVADSGILVTKVIYLKSNGSKSFVIVDAGMNDLIRQSLYDAYHEIIPVYVNKAASSRYKAYDVVGPVCETSDTLGYDIKLPKLKEKDLVVIKSAGAYGATMSSAYNSRLLIPEVMVKGSKFSIIRKRPSYEESMKSESVPGWI